MMAPAMSVYAHSPRGDPSGRWEPLDEHLLAVAVTARDFAEAFGWGGLAELLGRLHDIGKCSGEFQDYIRGTRTSGGDHSGAGAIEVGTLRHPFRHALAAIIAGHLRQDGAHTFRPDLGPRNVSWLRARSERASQPTSTNAKPSY